MCVQEKREKTAEKRRRKMENEKKAEVVQKVRFLVPCFICNFKFLSFPDYKRGQIEEIEEETTQRHREEVITIEYSFVIYF